jgi:hypothetical protein
MGRRRRSYVRLRYVRKRLHLNLIEGVEFIYERREKKTKMYKQIETDKKEDENVQKHRKEECTYG